MAIKRNIRIERRNKLIRLVCEQKSNKQIADEMGISKRGVESLRNKIMLETDSKNMVGLAIYGIKNGIYYLN